MTSNSEKISDGFREAMKDTRDVSVDTDVEDQRRARRKQELDNWSVDTGRALADKEGLPLDEARLEVVRCLRSHYLEHGLAETGRELGDMLDEQFDAAGGRKYLRRLFPGGPVTQGMKIAGLPVPEHTEDEGFGTAR